MTNGNPNWRKLVTDCLATVESDPMGPRSTVVDHEVVIDPATQPDDITVWCICGTAADQNTFTDTELPRFGSALRRELLRAGFPESAIASLTIRATTREAFDSPGGRGG